MCESRVGATQHGNMAKGDRRTLVIFNRISDILTTSGKWTPKDVILDHLLMFIYLILLPLGISA